MRFQNIKAEMARNDYTIQRLSKMIGICSNSLSFKLNGKREFTLSEIEKIANIFNKSIDFLVEHEIVK